MIAKREYFKKQKIKGNFMKSRMSIVSSMLTLSAFFVIITAAAPAQQWSAEQ